MFKISHGTVARMLQSMRDDGRLWQHAENGRFFPSAAAKILGRPNPVAVVLRRIHSWSALCRDVMSGFEEECALHEVPILLLHTNELLVEEEPGDQGTTVASSETQRRMLGEIHLRYGDLVGGYFLDEIWTDEAIAAALPSNLPIGTFYRRSNLAHVHSATPDFKHDALLALSQLFAKGCQRIVVIDPHSHHEAAHQFLAEVSACYRILKGHDLPSDSLVKCYEPTDLKRLESELCKTKNLPTGIIVPEDNVALSLDSRLRATCRNYEKLHHLIATMGSSQIPLDATFSVIRHNYGELGKSSAASLVHPGSKEQT